MKNQAQKNFTLIYEAIKKGYSAPNVFDAFEATDAVIESLPNFNNWISVEDKLPETWGDFLVAYETEREKETDDLTQYCSAWFCGDERVFHTKDQSFYKKRKCVVTHWQPLPKPPCKD